MIMQCLILLAIVMKMHTIAKYHQVIRYVPSVNPTNSLIITFCRSVLCLSDNGRVCYLSYGLSVHIL